MLVLKPVFPRLNGRIGTACDDSSTVLATAINPRSRNAIPARAESRMDKNDISSNVLDELTAQKYGPDASLDGRKIDFSFHVDDGGTFTKLFDAAEVLRTPCLTSSCGSSTARDSILAS